MPVITNIPPTLFERFAAVRRLSGRLQGLDDADSKWLGERLQTWLYSGGDLESSLGLKPPQGSHSTAQELMRRAEINRLLVSLSRELHGHKKASRVLQGIDAVPPGLAETVQRLRALRAPSSTRAFVRARGAPVHLR